MIACTGNAQSLRGILSHIGASGRPVVAGGEGGLYFTLGALSILARFEASARLKSDCRLAGDFFYAEISSAETVLSMCIRSSFPNLLLKSNLMQPT